MSKPTAIERHVYRECIGQFGEPNLAIMYDERSARVAPTLERTLVMVWRPTPDDEMTMFATVGMSAMPIPGATYRAELRMFVRGTLPVELERQLTKFLANVASYPFDHTRTIDWWHVLSNPGEMPAFANCSAVFLHGGFTDDSWDHSHCGDETVRFLNVVPITQEERAIAVGQGAAALQERWKLLDIDIFVDRAPAAVS